MVNPSYLDSRETINQVDKTGLFRILQEFPQQLESATQEFNKLKLPKIWAKVSEVIFCGMGGSTIGAELASDLPAELLRKPLFVIRDYNLPKFVRQETLVVIVSYSGDTEEPLSCFKQAQKVGAQIMIVTSGGWLANTAKTESIPNYIFNYKAPPRDGLGYLFVPLVKILNLTKVINEQEANLEKSLKLVKELVNEFKPEINTNQNRAKNLAYKIFDHIPLVVGAGILQGVARRWKEQFNEHGKSAAFFDILPALDHNTVEGFGFPTRFRDDAIVLLLTSSFNHPEVAKRFVYFKEYLKETHIVCEELVGQGDDIWSQKLSQIVLGDWTSYYLALLNRVDPLAIPVITSLKGRLRA
jgi:glucose/mannose-6-phosphate isomerase